jgi:hypothetical protein
MDFAEVSVPGYFARQLKVPLRSLLGAGLENSPIPSHRVTHRLTFDYRHARRLFTIHIFAGLGGGDGNYRVPMVLSGNHYRIDVLTGQQVTKVVVRGTAFVAVVLVNQLFSRLSPGFNDIANGSHPNACVIQERFGVVCTLTAGSDAAHYDTAARGNAFILA